MSNIMVNTEDRLRNIIEEIAKEEDYNVYNIDITPITSGGANYTADLYLATISESLKPDINLFSKVANIPEESRKSYGYLGTVYELEALFYAEMAVYFEKIYRKYQVPIKDRLVMPKCYKQVSNFNEEILVLENLSTKGFVNFNREKTFDWEYASTAMTQIAMFHALGISFRKEFPAEFEKIHGNLVVDFTKDHESVDHVMRMGYQNGLEVLNADHKQRVTNFFSKYDLTHMANNMMGGGDKTTLIHGDFRPSNLMHRRRNGKLEVIILDYQTFRLGSPAFDFTYFLYAGSDKEFRRLHYRRLIDHYFNQLTVALKHLNIDVEDVYSRKVFEAELNEFKPQGLLLSIAMMATLTVAPEDARTMDGDLSDMMVKPNQLAQKRIEEIVEDFIKSGIL